MQILSYFFLFLNTHFNTFIMFPTVYATFLNAYIREQISYIKTRWHSRKRSLRLLHERRDARDNIPIDLFHRLIAFNNAYTTLFFIII